MEEFANEVLKWFICNEKLILASEELNQEIKDLINNTNTIKRDRLKGQKTIRLPHKKPIWNNLALSLLAEDSMNLKVDTVLDVIILWWLERNSLTFTIILNMVVLNRKNISLETKVSDLIELGTYNLKNKNLNFSKKSEDLSVSDVIIWN